MAKLLDRVQGDAKSDDELLDELNRRSLSPKPTVSMSPIAQKRYRALEFIAGLYTIAGALTGIFGVIYGLIQMFSISPRGVSGLGIGVGIITIIASVLGAFSLMAVAQLFQILMDIAHNTNVTAEWISRMANRRRDG